MPDQPICKGCQRWKQRDVYVLCTRCRDVANTLRTLTYKVKDKSPTIICMESSWQDLPEVQEAVAAIYQWYLVGSRAVTPKLLRATDEKSFAEYQAFLEQNPDWEDQHDSDPKWIEVITK